MKNGVLLTPSLESGCLPGITRQVVLDLAARRGIAKEERAITPDDLLEADEVFLTSSIRGVESVSRVGEQLFTNNQVVDRLREYWSAEIAGKNGFSV